MAKDKTRKKGNTISEGEDVKGVVSRVTKATPPVDNSSVVYARAIARNPVKSKRKRATRVGKKVGQINIKR